MASALLAFCEWCNASAVGHAIRDSVWLFPFVEIFHLLALALLGGMILLLNMRLLGLRLRAEPIAALTRELYPWMAGAIAVMFISGFLLFSTEAVKMYGNWAFQLKMTFLLLAILYTFTIHRRLLLTADTHPRPLARALTVAISLLLWLAVGLGGRALGYVTTAVSSLAASR
ncbi:MAG TPA: DUF6644 family protein [Steroidobacteraceae bacterium]|nr:DUF6644 family protein [Steroidobacteraceae bacterium]